MPICYRACLHKLITANWLLGKSSLQELCKKHFEVRPRVAKPLFKHTVLPKDQLLAPVLLPSAQMSTGYSLDNFHFSLSTPQFIYISLITRDKHHSPEVTLDGSWLHPTTAGHKPLVPQSPSETRDHSPALPITALPGQDHPPCSGRIQRSEEVSVMQRKICAEINCCCSFAQHQL